MQLKVSTQDTILIEALEQLSMTLSDWADAEEHLANTAPEKWAENHLRIRDEYRQLVVLCDQVLIEYRS